MYAKYTIYRVYTQHTNAVRRIYSEEKINVRSALSEYVKVSVGTKVAAAQRDFPPTAVRTIARAMRPSADPSRGPSAQRSRGKYVRAAEIREILVCAPRRRRARSPFALPVAVAVRGLTTSERRKCSAERARRCTSGAYF